jgi:hypothetical protein
MWKAQEASYYVNFRIDISGKSRVVVEEFILPAAKELAFILCGEKKREVTRFFPCFPSRSIQDMAAYIKQIYQNCKYFAVQY